MERSLENRASRRKRQTDQTAHHEHAANGPGAEHQQVNKPKNGVPIVRDLRYDQQCQRGRTGQTMHHPDEHRSPAWQTAVRSFYVIVVAKVKVDVPLSSMSVRMDVPTHEPHSQEDDHQGDDEFQNIGDALGYGKAEDQNKETRDQHGRGVASTPKNADCCGLPYRTPLTNDRRDRSEVVRFCGVFQPQQKAETQSCQHRIMHY